MFCQCDYVENIKVGIGTLTRKLLGLTVYALYFSLQSAVVYQPMQFIHCTLVFVNTKRRNQRWLTCMYS